MENCIIKFMKSLQAPNLKTIALTKVIDATIRSYDEEEFDNMIEESEIKKLYRKEIVLSFSISRHG